MSLLPTSTGGGTKKPPVAAVAAAALLPHAHKKYAGSVQKAVLDALFKAADLDALLGDFAAGGAATVVFVPACHDECTKARGAHDHSVDFLRDTLDEFQQKISAGSGGSSSLIVVDPIPYDEKSTAETIAGISALIAATSPRPVILIGTVDLSHHEFPAGTPYPRLRKMRAEEETIVAFCKRGGSRMNPRYIDAPWSVKIVHHFAPADGVVVAYEDSSSDPSPQYDATKKYFADSFVSYVGIVYSPKRVPAAEVLYDTLMAASVKNTVYHTYHNTGLANQTEAPAWALLVAATKAAAAANSSSSSGGSGGVWAGVRCVRGGDSGGVKKPPLPSSAAAATKCSLGRTQVQKIEDAAAALRESAAGCVGDAERRWGGFSSSSNGGGDGLAGCIYKYERLSELVPVQWSSRASEFNPDTTGILLTLKDGRSATYLPGVWREHWPDKGIDYVLSQLAAKAGGGSSNSVSSDIASLHKYTTAVTEVT